MDPKQTAPQGSIPAGGKEGQNGSPTGAAATPVFSASGSAMPAAAAPSVMPTASSSAASSAGGKSVPGTLGAEQLSTGANVSRTMDTLNSKNQATQGGLTFAKHRFDKIDPGTGDIILTPDHGPKRRGGLFSFGRKRSGANTQTESTSIVENTHRDVVIPAEFQNRPPEKKSHRGLIIGFVAVLTVGAIVAVVVAVILPNMQKNSSKGQGTTTVVVEEEIYSADVITDQNVIKRLSAQKDNADWLEFAISVMYEGLNIIDYMRDVYDRQGDTAINGLENLLDYLTRNGYGPDELEFTSVLADRLPVYSEIISTLNTLSEYLLDPVANKQEFDTLIASASQAEQLAINKLADKAKTGAPLEFWADNTYIPEIVNAIAPPINYDVDGTLSSMIVDLITSEVGNG